MRCGLQTERPLCCLSMLSKIHIFSSGRGVVQLHPMGIGAAFVISRDTASHSYGPQREQCNAASTALSLAE